MKPEKFENATLGEDEQKVKIAHKINDLTDFSCKNLAIYLLGDMGPRNDVSFGDVDKLTDFIVDYDKNLSDDIQEDVLDYIDNRIEKEERTSWGAPLESDGIKPSLYGYEIGINTSEEINKLKKEGVEPENIENIALLRVLAKNIKDDNLYFPQTMPENSLQYLSVTENQFGGDVSKGLKTAKEIINRGNSYIIGDMRADEYIETARKLEENIEFTTDCYSTYLESLEKGKEIVTNLNEQLNTDKPKDDGWVNELTHWQKSDRFKENAAQELFERDFNRELTKVEDLKLAIEAGEKGIAGGTFEIPSSDGNKYEIFLIALKGYPFKTIQSDITLTNTNDISNAGDTAFLNRTGEALRKDPSLWVRKKSEVDDLGKKSSAIFSASYYDTEIGVPEMMGGLCSYGFDHVRPNTVIDVVKGDANTVPYKDSASPEFGYIEGRSNEKQPIELNELADVGHSIWNRCNEIVINRYDDSGNPQKPDYILARGREGVNGLTVKHAAYHNVPLICIMPDCYKEIKIEDEIKWDPDWDQGN